MEFLSEWGFWAVVIVAIGGFILASYYNRKG